MSVLVVGSFIVDCIARCDRAPEAGETVVGNSFNIYLGGKGANQAFAAKRMGSETIIAGAIGDDVFGKDFLKALKKEGFDTSFIKIVKNFTGTSLVTVEESGQNRICMTPGANLDYSVEDLNTLEETISGANVIVTQLEMRYEVMKHLAELAKKHHKKFILNPAPARIIEDEVFPNIYIITPNETELGILDNQKISTFDEYVAGAKELLKRGVENVIVTLGEKGSLLVNKDGHQLVAACKVNVIDTVGAGDAFTGSLASQIDQGKSIIEAMHIATHVSALEIQKHGAIPAMPYKDEVLKFMNERRGKYGKN